VKRVALAGGIGAGKTALTQYLASRGFGVVDADEIARDVVAVGTPALAALVDAFGAAILTESGDLDRAFVADIVFHDATALARLNAITHGYIGDALKERLNTTEGDLVFVAVPLYHEELRASLRLDEVWVVMVEPETAVARLVEGRGFRESDARARLDAQFSNAEREALADRVFWNEGSREELFAQIDHALVELTVDA